MQLSAANLLIASQQLTKTNGPAPKVEAQFALPSPERSSGFAQAGKALAKETGTDGFSALSFKQTATAAPQTPAQPAQGYGQNQRPGSQLDIRI